MKATKPKSKNLRNHQHFELFDVVKALLGGFAAIVQKVQPQYDAFVRCLRDEDEALQRIVKSRWTPKVKAADEERDNYFRGLMSALKAELRSPDPAMREAAENVKIATDAYGNLAIKQYDEESSGIYNLLQDLTGKYAADVAKVGLRTWVERLETANNNFRQLMKERGDETAEKTELAMKESREKTEKAYRSLIEQIEALAKVEGPDAYAEFVRRHNVEVDRFNDTVARQKGKGGKAPDAPKKDA